MKSTIATLTQDLNKFVLSFQGTTGTPKVIQTSQKAAAFRVEHYYAVFDKASKRYPDLDILGYPDATTISFIFNQTLSQHSVSIFQHVSQSIVEVQEIGTRNMSYLHLFQQNLTKEP